MVTINARVGGNMNEFSYAEFQSVAYNENDDDRIAPLPIYDVRSVD